MDDVDLAILVGKSTSTIRRWKRKCGLSSSKSPIFETETKTKKKDDISIVPPKNWDNKRWFEDMYNNNQLSLRQIAAILGRSKNLVIARLDEYGIEKRTHNQATKSENDFCNEEWLKKYYENNLWPIEWCAQAASVSNETINDWLVKFGIKKRTRAESISAQARKKRDLDQ